MRRVSILQPKVLKFRNELVDYANLLAQNHHQAASQLCPSLNLDTRKASALKINARKRTKADKHLGKGWQPYDKF